MPNFSAGSKTVNPCKFKIGSVLDKVIINLENLKSTEMF